MDINDERAIGRMIRDLAAECGFDLMPGGFQIVVNLDEDGDGVVAHLILTTTGERIGEVLAEKAQPDDQKEIDAMFDQIASAEQRGNLKDETDEIAREIQKRLEENGGEFL